MDLHGGVYDARKRPGEMLAAMWTELQVIVESAAAGGHTAPRVWVYWRIPYIQPVYGPGLVELDPDLNDAVRPYEDFRVHRIAIFAPPVADSAVRVDEISVSRREGL